MAALYWGISYLLGTILTAYILARWKNVDLATSGSGNFGARNAGRVMGKSAFVITMLGDALKGAIVVVAGHVLHFTLLEIAIACIFVVLGHVFPFWHRFKGGKGVATGVGALLFFIPQGILLLVMGFAAVALITKSSTKGMLGAFIMYAGYFVVNWSMTSIAVFILLCLIVWANRENVAERVL